MNEINNPYYNLLLFVQSQLLCSRGADVNEISIAQNWHASRKFVGENVWVCRRRRIGGGYERTRKYNQVKLKIKKIKEWNKKLANVEFD